MHILSLFFLLYSSRYFSVFYKNSHFATFILNVLICFNRLKPCFRPWIKKKWDNRPAGICLFKVNNRNTRTFCEIWSKWTRHQSDVTDVVLVSLLLNLNRFHTLFWCFYSLLWTSKCRLGANSSAFPKRQYFIQKRSDIWDALHHLVPFKSMKNTHGGVLLLIKLLGLVCNCTKRIFPSFGIFHIFQIYKWYQIAQRVSYGLRIIACIANFFKAKFDSGKIFSKVFSRP